MTLRSVRTFPHIATLYLHSIGNTTVKLIKINGSVEAMPFLKFNNRHIDGIIDIVRTGETIRSNSLKLDGNRKIGTYQPVIISNRNSMKKHIIAELFK